MLSQWGNIRKEVPDSVAQNLNPKYKLPNAFWRGMGNIIPGSGLVLPDEWANTIALPRRRRRRRNGCCWRDVDSSMADCLADILRATERYLLD